MTYTNPTQYCIYKDNFCSREQQLMQQHGRPDWTPRRECHPERCTRRDDLDKTMNEWLGSNQYEIIKRVRLGK